MPCPRRHPPVRHGSGTGVTRTLVSVYLSGCRTSGRHVTVCGTLRPFRDSTPRVFCSASGPLTHRDENYNRMVSIVTTHTRPLGRQWGWDGRGSVLVFSSSRFVEWKQSGRDKLERTTGDSRVNREPSMLTPTFSGKHVTVYPRLKERIVRISRRSLP